MGEKVNDLNVGKVDFRPVAVKELAGLFRSVLPDGAVGVKEKWITEGGKWVLKDIVGLKMVGIRVNEDDRCAVTFVNIQSQEFEANRFGEKSEFGTEEREDGSLAVQVKSTSKNGEIAIRRFYKIKG